MSVRSKADWKERIEPHLSSSLESASEEIMRTEAVHAWLRKAASKAAEDMGPRPGMQQQMQGYGQLIDGLKSEFPNLREAVHELTDGWGHLDIQWRPMQPGYSRIYIDLDLEYNVSLYFRLENCSGAAARTVLKTTEEALPQGEPFPNRPNTVTGFVTRAERGIGLRLKEHRNQRGSGTYHTITLIPPDASPLDKLGGQEAIDHLLKYLCSTEGTA